MKHLLPTKNVIPVSPSVIPVSPSVIPVSPSVIPVSPSVIPAKAGIYTNRSRIKCGMTMVWLFLILATPALAADSVPLTVAPARQQMEMKPGETSTGILKLINTSSSPISGSLKAADFIIEDDQGTPQFLEDQNFSSNYSAAQWIKLPYDRLTIPANDKVEIQFKIKTDLAALPGGHYAGIIFEAVSGDFSSKTSSGASIAPRIASLIYITIPGDYQEQAFITKFHIPKFSQHGPLNVNTSIKNQSPVHLRPKGVITISNMFGDVLTHLQLDEQNVFPGAERTYLNTIPTKWLIGRYQARLQAAYGSQGKTLEAIIFFTVIPLALIGYLLVFILAVAFIARHYGKKNKKYQLRP